MTMGRRRFRPLTGLWVSMLVAASPLGLLAQTVPSDTEIVALVEEWASDRVVGRGLLTREAFRELLIERASAQLIGYDPGSLGQTESENGEAGAHPRTQADAEREVRETQWDSSFERSRISLLGDAPEPPPAEPDEAPAVAPPPVRHPLEVIDAPDPLIDESDRVAFDERLMSSAPTLGSLDPRLREMITAPLHGSTPTDHLEAGLQRMHLQIFNQEERNLDRAERRIRRRFENMIIESWVDRALILMEARRRGYEVTDAMVAEALIPMIQARLAQINSAGDEPGEVRLRGVGEVENLERTLAVVSDSPTATSEPGVRRSVRDSVNAILTEIGYDPDRFHRELQENLLIEQLIRATVYEFYTEEDLRQFHREHLAMFIHPPRYQYLSMKYIPRRDQITGAVLDNPDEIEETREAFRDVSRRLRRIEDDMPLDEVRSLWGEAREREDGLPPATYLTLSHFQSLADMSPDLASAMIELEIGQTSRVIETQRGFFIVRVVDIIPAIGEEFEEARPFVEQTYFNEIRGQMIEALRSSSRHHIFINRRGLPLSEVLERIGSPGMR